MHPQLRSIFSRPAGTSGRRRTGGLVAAATMAAVVGGLLPGVAAAAPLPTVDVQDTTTVDPAKGETKITYVTLRASEAAPGAKVSWQLVPGTAKAGTDYVAASGTATLGDSVFFPVPVTIIGDNAEEGIETFSISLSSPVGVTIGDGSGVITINDNDTPRLSVGAAAITEKGPNDHPKITFRFVLSRASTKTISVKVGPKSGSLTWGTEVQKPPTKTLTFQPGQTVKTMTLTTTGDLRDEGTEYVRISLGGYVNAWGPYRAKGAVNDDDCTGSDPGATTAKVLTAVNADAGADVRTVDAKIKCEGEHDWYRVDLNETKQGITDDTDLTARVRLLVGDNPVQGGDLDVCVYKEMFSDADTLIACSTQTGTADETVELRGNDSTITDDTTTVWIRVRHHTGSFGPNSYTLKVFGNVPVSVSSNF
jgi:hypothetical protein